MIYALEFQGCWHDAGTVLGFLKTTVAFALLRPDVAPGFKEFLRGLDLVCRDVFLAQPAHGDAQPRYGRKKETCTVKDHETELPEPEGSEGQPEIEVGVEQPQGERKMPQDIPLLPVRDVVVFPFMILPLFVGREKSIRAVDEALSRDRLSCWSPSGMRRPRTRRPRTSTTSGPLRWSCACSRCPMGGSRSWCRGSLVPGEGVHQPDPYFEVKIGECRSRKGRRRGSRWRPCCVR